MHKTTFKIDPKKKNHLKYKNSTKISKEIYKLKEKSQEYETFWIIIKQIGKNQTRKKHLQTMFNRGPNNFGGEKELYQQKKQAHEYMQTSSKIPTKENWKNKKQSALYNF